MLLLSDRGKIEGTALHFNLRFPSSLTFSHISFAKCVCKNEFYIWYGLSHSKYKENIRANESTTQLSVQKITYPSLI